ncbi:MAG: hypothetical protein EHM33_01855 [Chloroflexi bacterium]|nr:MAG: hypothetical protein EHM33_01855 [Chloroflexota bacterium]
MTLRTQRQLILVAALIIAGILAFPLRETIYKTVVIPAAFIAWNLNLLYRSFSQGIWWWIVVFIVLLMLALSIVPRATFRSRDEVKRKPPLGQVEALAVWLRKAERGIYFKWLIANRLGKLAYQILLHRESGRPRSVFAPLLGPDWEPTRELQMYLETGLHGSFADYPNVKRPFGVPQATPLDLDLVEAVDFLESQVENGNHRHSHAGVSTDQRG